MVVFELCLGTVSTGSKGVELLTGLGVRDGAEGKNLGEAVLDVTGLCKFHPCSFLGSSVPPQAWGLGLGFGCHI